MITKLDGIVTEIYEHHITLSLQHIGFTVHIAQSTLIKKDQELQLYIHMHWHQEQGPVLYGFFTTLEKKIFLLIIGCSGIGPKLALTVLAHMQPQEFINTIQQQNERMLSTVPGIGAKKAEQIIVQLKHKVAQLLEDEPLSIVQNQSVEHWHTLNQVLTSLNYSRTEIAHALNYVREKDNQSSNFDHLLRSALSYLSKRIQ